MYLKKSDIENLSNIALATRVYARQQGEAPKGSAVWNDLWDDTAACSYAHNIVLDIDREHNVEMLQGLLNTARKAGRNMSQAERWTFVLGLREAGE
jgi:hypothetical protein